MISVDSGTDREYIIPPDPSLSSLEPELNTKFKLPAAVS